MYRRDRDNDVLRVVLSDFPERSDRQSSPQRKILKVPARWLGYSRLHEEADLFRVEVQKYWPPFMQLFGKGGLPSSKRSVDPKFQCAWPPCRPLS